MKFITVVIFNTKNLTNKARIIFYFDFETMHKNAKHTANYMCAISQDGEEFTAEWIDFVDKMVKHFRCPNFADFTFTAQNASGFDSYILLEYFTNQRLAPKMIL